MPACAGKKLIARAPLNLVPNFMDTNCGVSVNLSQLPSSTTPLHIVLWKGVDTANPTVSSTTATATAPAPLNLETNDTIKRLLDRITVLEGMVSGLLETQKSSIWFSPGLRPTPTGIEVVSRRDSMGEESDIGTVLSQLVRPSGVDNQNGGGNQNGARTVTIAPVATTMAPAATGPEPEVTPSGLEEEEAVEEVVEEEEEAEEATPNGLEEEAEEATPNGLEEEAVEEVAEEAVEEEEVEATPSDGLEEATPSDGLEEATPNGLEEEEEEEKVVEYKPIEWKGQSYWVDDNQQVYEMDSDGDLIETPIGVWREATQKLVRYKAP